MDAKFLGHQPQNGDCVKVIAVEAPDDDDPMKHTVGLEAKVIKPRPDSRAVFDLETPVMIEGDPEPVTGWVFGILHTVTLELVEG